MASGSGAALVCLARTWVAVLCTDLPYARKFVVKFCSRSLTARISLLAPLILCGEGSPMALLLRLSDLFFATAAPDFSL